MACARKAHNVEDDGGAEACSSTPQAACLSTMVTLLPLLGVSDPWYQISSLALGRRSTPASCSSLWSKRYDPLLRHGVEGAGGLGSLGYQSGTSEPPPGEHGPATCPEWLITKQTPGAAAMWAQNISRIIHK